LWKILTIKDVKISSQGLAPLDYYFSEIEKLSDDKNWSSRVRFMLKDVVDLRRSNWKPRRDVAGPKTIDQVTNNKAHNSEYSIEGRSLIK
jgi:translation initiation factor 4G